MSETVERVTPGTTSWDQYGAEHIQRYKFFTEYYRNKSIIDAACGTGYGTHYIINSGATRVIGIDISDEAITFCKSNYVKPSLEYKKLDCLKINELSEKFDVAVSFETIEHLDDPEAFIKNTASVLKPEGIFICSTPNKSRLSGAGNINPYHPNELEWTDFKRIFQKYFSVQNSYHQTETLEYLRIQELKHLMHQNQAATNSLLLNRIELKLRKLFNRNFKPIKFIHTHLDDLHEQDLHIEPLIKDETWHKTFIIVGKLKV